MAQNSSVVIKLPQFLAKKPKAWFAQVEAQFAIHNITNDETKYNYVVAALDSSIADRVSDYIEEPPENHKYSGLKNRLVVSSCLSSYERSCLLIDGHKLCKEKPSSLMARMMALASDYDQKSDLFKALFIRRLPVDIRGPLIASDNMDCLKLAQLADSLWLTSSSSSEALMVDKEPPETMAKTSEGKQINNHFDDDYWLKRSFESCEFEEKVKPEVQDSNPTVVAITNTTEKQKEALIAISSQSQKENETSELSHQVPKSVYSDKVAVVNTRAARPKRNPGAKFGPGHHKTISGLEEASISPTPSAFKCIFKCTECSGEAIFPNWSSLCFHMKKKHSNHNMTISKHEQYLSRAEVHVCKVCDNKILCDFTFLRYHFLKHGLKMSEYQTKYNFPVKKKTKQKVLSVAEVSDEIGNQCTFKCIKCDHTVQNYSALKYHSKRCKSDTWKICKKNMWMYLQKVVKHKCKICSEMIYCDNEIIGTHVKHFHKIRSLEEYSIKTGCSVNTHINERNSTLDELTRNARVSEKIGNLCCYSCVRCGHTAKSWRIMKSHLKSSDVCSVKNGKWFKYISKAVVHECRVCGKKVLNEREFVKEHLRKCHQETVLCYVEKHKVPLILRD